MTANFKAGIVLFAALVMGALLFAGCTNFGGNGPADNAQASGQQGPNGFGGGARNGFQNMTPEQRQAMIDARTQAAAAACAGKNEGDACTMQFPEGSGSRNGFEGGNGGIRNGSNWSNGTPGNATPRTPINRTPGNSTGTCKTQQDGSLSCVYG